MLDIGVGGEIGSGDGEVVELLVVTKVIFGYSRSVNNCAKYG